MNLIPLADLLENAGLGVKGESIFIGMMPAESDQAILLRNPLSGTLINHEMPGFFQSHIQLIVRTPSVEYSAGESLIERAIAALTASEKQIGTAFFNYIRPRTLPVVYPLSKGNLLEFNVVLDVCFAQGV